MRSQHAESWVTIPDLHHSSRLEHAKILLHKKLVNMTRNHQARIFDHDQIKLFVGKGPRLMSKIVLNKSPFHVLVWLAQLDRGSRTARGQGRDVNARELDPIVTSLLVVSVAHHAPKSCTTSDLQHPLRGIVSDEWRVDGCAIYLDHQERPQALAMELSKVGGKRVRRRRVVVVGAAIFNDERLCRGVRVGVVCRGHGLCRDSCVATCRGDRVCSRKGEVYLLRR